MSIKPSVKFVLFMCGAALPAMCPAEIAIEGTVGLPKTLNIPVANERYEIVSEAGVLKTDPPRAVVYLEGKFPKPASSRDFIT